jgi:hypothetical protein
MSSSSPSSYVFLNGGDDVKPVRRLSLSHSNGLRTSDDWTNWSGGHSTNNNCKVQGLVEVEADTVEVWRFKFYIF